MDRNKTRSILVVMDMTQESNERNDMSRALTDQEREVFERILNGDGIGLVQTAFDGEDTAVIAEFVMDDEGDVVEVHPLAVLLTDALFDRLTPPEGATEVNGPDDGGFFDDEDEHPADCDGTVEAPYEGFGGQPVTGTCQHPSHRDPFRAAENVTACPVCETELAWNAEDGLDGQRCGACGHVFTGSTRITLSEREFS